MLRTAAENVHRWFRRMVSARSLVREGGSVARALKDAPISFVFGAKHPSGGVWRGVPFIPENRPLLLRSQASEWNG